MELTKLLAEFGARLKFIDLPAETVDMAQYLALDFIGVAARGSLEESSRVMLEFARGLGVPGDGVVIASGYATAPQYAALVNGTYSHSLEMDDVNNEASLHPAVAVFPAALAAAQMTGCRPADFITGVVWGYEVMVRLGKALGPARHYGRGFHPTGTCGVFGAAAAASKILGLDREKTVSALGIAGSQAAASMEFLATGAWTKRMHPGWAAHSGLLAALLAQKGFLGPSTIIEGKSGFLRSYSPGPDPSQVLDGLGNGYQIVRTSIKPHSCCRYKQAPIDGILRIMRENNLTAADVTRIVIGMLKVSFPIVVEPPDLKRRPKSVVDAQFSMPFGAAVAVLYGKALLDQYTQKYLELPEVIELMQKVRCVEDEELDRTYPRQWRASVEIETVDGRRFRTNVDYPKGDPENPLTWDELIDKFNSITSPVFSFQRREKIVQKVRTLSADEGLAELLDLVSRGDAAGRSTGTAGKF